MYRAFGDESIGPEYIAYGTVLVCEGAIAEATSIINLVKTKSGASASDRLHCRELFSGQQRKKTAWKNFGIAEIFELYGELIAHLDHLLIRKLVSIGKKTVFPKSIPGGQWQTVDLEFIGPLPWSNGWDFGEKHIALLGAQGTMIPLSKWPGFDRMSFWPDPDVTPISTSTGRKKFSQQLSAFVDNGNGGEPPRVEVRYAAEKPDLLQIADLVAYVAQRAARGGYEPIDRKFTKLNQQINAEYINIGVAPDGGIGINVPDKVRDFVAP